MLLDFNAEGLVPPGDHSLTLSQLRTSILVVGPPDKAVTWDAKWRLRLVNNLEILVCALWKANIKDIFIGGSFAEDEDHPNDIDGYFVPDYRDFITGEMEKRLNLIGPESIWRWDERHCRADRQGKPQIPMWHRFSVELWPGPIGQMSGVPDRNRNILPVSEAFRQSRRYRPRGMIKIEADP